MNSIFRRTLSLFLALMMCISMLPVSALAEDASAPDETEETIEITGQLPEEQAEESSPVKEDESAEQESESESAEPLATEDITEEEPVQLNASIVSSGSCGESLEWILDEEGLLTISGTGDMDNYTIGDEPWYSYVQSIKSVKIDSDVTNIGNYAFSSCVNLVTVKIPDSVTSIGNYAFSECASLTSAEIPDSVTSIGNYAFSECVGLTSVEIPNSVISIGYYAFSECASLTSVEIPDSVTDIGNNAFSKCTGLTNAEIGNGIKGIGNNMFYNCNSLVCVKIGGSVTKIGERAFSGCVSLTEVEIPDSVESIEKEAFYNCVNLNKITFKHNADQTLNIKTNAFKVDNITIETTVKVIDPENMNTAISKYKWSGSHRAVSYEKISLIISSGNCGDNLAWTLDADGLLTISGTGDMDSYADSETPWYSYHSSIKSVKIESGVTTIGDGAFYDCESLTCVEIPKSVTGIGIGAFAWCCNLISVDIPDSITAIGDYAFYGCESLSCIGIPAGVTNIGNYTFCCCSGLQSITVSDDNEFYSSIDGVLFNKAETTLICRPGGKTGSYSVPNGVSGIGSYAFYCCIGLTGVEIPDSVAVIGDSAFEDCTGLNEITFEHNAANELSIGYHAFYVNTDYGGTIATAIKVATLGNKHTAISGYDWEGSGRDVTFEKLVIYGDANLDGTINVEDVYLLRKAAAGLATLTDEQKAVADVYTDGRYNALDVNLLRRSIAGIITDIPYSA